MDRASKKIELVEWLLHSNDEAKLKKVITLKSVLDKEVVAKTISGYPIDREEYNQMVKRLTSVFLRRNILQWKI